MRVLAQDGQPVLEAADWQKMVAPYLSPSLRKSSLQLATSVLPFALCWGFAAWCFQGSVALCALFCVLSTGFLVRIYIIQHDCGHGSFFRSRRTNDLLGCGLGVITLLPYFRWRHDHAIHHATHGNLARRGSGDVWTMTVREYAAATPWMRLRYRLFRSPWVLLGLGPFVLFVLWQRVADRRSPRRERWSVYGTNLALAMVVWMGGLLLGWKRFLFVHGLVSLLGATTAVWLFYVQHQYEQTYWAEPEEWDYTQSAMAGASWYKLPPLLQWFSGNIGLHHVHHLSPKIPNYELQRCLEENPRLQGATVVSGLSAFSCLSLKLWDEELRRLVGWREAEVTRPFAGWRIRRRRKKSQAVRAS